MVGDNTVTLIPKKGCAYKVQYKGEELIINEETVFEVGGDVATIDTSKYSSKDVVDPIPVSECPFDLDFTTSYLSHSYGNGTLVINKELSEEQIEMILGTDFRTVTRLSICTDLPFSLCRLNADFSELVSLAITEVGNVPYSKYRIFDNLPFKSITTLGIHKYSGWKGYRELCSVKNIKLDKCVVDSKLTKLLRHLKPEHIDAREIASVESIVVDGEDELRSYYRKGPLLERAIELLGHCQRYIRKVKCSSLAVATCNDGLAFLNLVKAKHLKRLLIDDISLIGEPGDAVPGYSLKHFTNLEELSIDTLEGPLDNPKLRILNCGNFVEKSCIPNVFPSTLSYDIEIASVYSLGEKTYMNEDILIDYRSVTEFNNRPAANSLVHNTRYDIVLKKSFNLFVYEDYLIIERMLDSKNARNTAVKEKEDTPLAEILERAEECTQKIMRDMLTKHREREARVERPQIQTRQVRDLTPREQEEIRAIREANRTVPRGYERETRN